MTVPRVLELIRQAGLRVPVIVMTYLNPVLAYGLERFLVDAAAAGTSGLLLTDLPAGADPALEAQVRASPVALIRLIAPTTTPARLARAVQEASGFLYLISRLGVTGVRDQVPGDLADQVARVRGVSALPLAIGFGIATPAQARAAAQLADGVVVGSALVEALGAGGLRALERLVRDLAGAVRARAGEGVGDGDGDGERQPGGGGAGRTPERGRRRDA
jgi:tryptophan synthase alpha chain